LFVGVGFTGGLVCSSIKILSFNTRELACTDLVMRYTVQTVGLSKTFCKCSYCDRTYSWRCQALF
jgi:hypothetical protein